jgi:hypothetical protein
MAINKNDNWGFQSGSRQERGYQPTKPGNGYQPTQSSVPPSAPKPPSTGSSVQKD